MKDEIKEIENHLKKCSECFTCQYFLGEDEKGGHCKLINILDHITNLQEKSNNQAEEINRLVKQKEKFMKKYGYLKEENEKLKKEKNEAINYIKNEIWNYYNDGEIIDRIVILNLLNILNGGVEE